MTKSQAVKQTKLANTRLAPIYDGCSSLLHKTNTRPIKREIELIQNRVKRELDPNEPHAMQLQILLSNFFSLIQRDSFDEKEAMKFTNAIHQTVRSIQSNRWKAIESQYGSVSHYFDGFGQIKPQYRYPKHDEAQPSNFIPRQTLLLHLALSFFFLSSSLSLSSIF